MYYDGSTPYVKQYNIGEEVTIQNEKYNVIGQGNDYVTLLKQEPLTVAEVNTYGTGHVNMYSDSSSDSYYHQARDWNGIGGMAYYSSPTCGYNGSRWIRDGCTTDYNSSEVKYVVDAWAADKFQNDELKEVDNYKARLIQFSELQQFYPSCSESAYYCSSESATPSWLYAPNHEDFYWTMSQYQDSSSNVWHVYKFGYLYSGSDVSIVDGAARPVINLYKSKL